MEVSPAVLQMCSSPTQEHLFQWQKRHIEEVVSVLTIVYEGGRAMREGAQEGEEAGGGVCLFQFFFFFFKW